MSIAENLRKIKAQIGDHVTLVAVSKYSTEEEVMEAYRAGQRDFGENKVQDLEIRKEYFPDDVRWHFIGHLQRNKVKFIAPFIHLIHAVDSLRLLREINKQAKAVNRVIPCLLQLRIAEEDTKFGMTEEEILNVLKDPQLNNFKNIEIKGIMGMATYTEDKSQIEREFEKVRVLFHKIKTETELKNVKMEEMSIGMSQDYPIAIEKGATMIRLGSSIFKS